MIIKTSENFCIITPISNSINNREALRLQEELTNNEGYDIALDLSYVEDCSIDFIELLKSAHNISLFNISSDIFALFYAMGIDRLANLFVSELDFKANKHRLLQRNFKII